MSPVARYRSVDALRGLIMILMAVDHASAFIARQHASEFWSGAMSAYTSVFPFLTRLVTHLCAPGFFFLMGAGVHWFAASRRDAGWTEAQVVRRTVWRGFVLFVIAQFMEAPLMVLQGRLKPAAVSLNTITAPPPNDGSALYWGFLTLSALGLVLMLCGLLLRLRPWIWLLVSALCVIASNSLLPSTPSPGTWWNALLLAPGLAQHIIVVYPVIPWLGVAAAGLYFGYWWRSNPETAQRHVWIIGAAMLIVAVGLRTAGGWGNIRPPRDSGWIEFLNNVKYPPSLVFWTMAVGINLLILELFRRLPEIIKSPNSPLIVFGQTPLFFYVAHFYLLTGAAFAFYREPATLEGAYVAWAVALLVLYPLCRWYRTFKMGNTKESLWRLF